jgi:outer membrane protein
MSLIAMAPQALRAEDVPLTLAEALATAERQNPELLAARAHALSIEARSDALRKGRQPRLTAATAWSRTDNPTLVFSNKLNAGEFGPPDFAIDRLNDPGSLSHLVTSVGLEVPIDVFGKIKDAADGQAATGRAARAAEQEAALDTRLRVIESYRRAALARQALEVTEHALSGARAREADMEARVGEGASLRADLLRTKARRRQREADLALGRAEAAIAQATLARLLGAEPGTSFLPVDSPAAPKPLAGEETEWVARGLRDRAAIRAAAERVDALRRGARLEGRGLLPDVLAYGLVQDDRTTISRGGQSYAVGVGLRWSAFDPARSHREAAANAELRAAELDARAAVEQVRLEAAAAFRGALAAREQWAAAAGGAEEGREALRVTQERRQAGLATLSDELETEAASLAAELAEVRAAAAVAVADAWLDRAVGGGG